VQAEFELLLGSMIGLSGVLEDESSAELELWIVEELLGTAEELLGSLDEELSVTEELELGIAEELLGTAEELLGSLDEELSVTEELELGIAEELLGAMEELLLSAEDEETAVSELEEEFSAEELEYFCFTSASLGNSRVGFSVQDKNKVMVNPKIASVIIFFCFTIFPKEPC